LLACVQKRKMSVLINKNESMLRHRRDDARIYWEWFYDLFLDEGRDEFRTSAEALDRLRCVRPDNANIIGRLFGCIRKEAIADQVLYELVMTRSFLDFRILHSLQMVPRARRIRQNKLREALGMALHARLGQGSRFTNLDIGVFQRMFVLAYQDDLV